MRIKPALGGYLYRSSAHDNALSLTTACRLLIIWRLINCEWIRCHATNECTFGSIRDLFIDATEIDELPGELT